MKHLTILAALTAATLSAPHVSAQGTLTTATGYGVFANAGTGDVDGVPAGRTIGLRGLAIAARDGDAAGGAGAQASTRVAFGPAASALGTDVAVHESGDAAARAGNRSAAGTSDDPRQASPGAHGLSWTIPAPAGAQAAVRVSWRGSATLGAATGAQVDVDGDGTPDFGANISGGRGERTRVYPVVAGPRGFHIAISTNGQARSNGGLDSYSATLSVNFEPRIPGGRCNFRAFGPECGGKLEGRSAGGPGRTAFGISLSEAAANAPAALAIGSPLPMPVQLPGGRCPLLVNPAAVLPGRTDPMGNATWAFALPGTPSIRIALQAVTLEASSGGPLVKSSNGLAASCN